MEYVPEPPPRARRRKHGRATRPGAALASLRPAILALAPLALTACFGFSRDTEHDISVTISIAESTQSALAPGRSHLLVIEEGEAGKRKRERKVLMRLCPSDAGTASYIYKTERRNCPKDAAFQAFIYETNEAVPVCGNVDLPEAVDERTSRLVATSSEAVWKKPRDCRSRSRSEDTRSDIEAVIR